MSWKSPWFVVSSVRDHPLQFHPDMGLGRISAIKTGVSKWTSLFSQRKNRTRELMRMRLQDSVRVHEWRQGSPTAFPFCLHFPRQEGELGTEYVMQVVEEATWKHKNIGSTTSTGECKDMSCAHPNSCAHPYYNHSLRYAKCSTLTGKKYCLRAQLSTFWEPHLKCTTCAWSYKFKRQ